MRAISPTTRLATTLTANTRLLATLTLFAAVAAAPLAAQAAPVEAASVSDYTVFVDAPTGFVFVKLPQGWKFAGKADGALPARLPGHVVSRVLPADAESALPAGQQLAASAKL
jgi:hypothetical protein